MARNVLSKRVGFTLLLAVSIAVTAGVITVIPPHIAWAPVLLAGAIFCCVVSMGMLGCRYVRRSILAGILVSGLILLRYYELDTVVNLALLIGIVGVAEVYFWG